MASFDKDSDLDPQLAGISLSALHAKYVQQFEGYTLCEMMSKHAQDGGDAKLAPKLEKAIDGVLADVKTLVEALPPGEGADEVPGDASKEGLLLEIYWRVHDAWKANPEAAGSLKLIAHDANGPKWKDLEALFGELMAVDHDGGDGDNFPSNWYEDLLTRLDTKPGKVKKKAAAAKPAPVIATPPANATIHDYSPKLTMQVGQWVRHPKFGVGRVAEVGTHATLEFAGERKVLAHTAATVAPPSPPPGKSRSSVDTVELARAAGIEIKKIPGHVPEE